MAKIEYGTYYHLFNRGNNRTDIFRGKDNYIHFLFLIQKYVMLVADIYCYCLMRNHIQLFNSYAKWFNIKYKRTGSLFEKNYKKKEILNNDHLKRVVYYIYHNPIHHGFTTNFMDYP